MKESQFIGTLIPSHPDFQPIIQEIRQKYRLQEVDPDGESIKEIFLGDETISLEDFKQDIRNLVEREDNTVPSPLTTIYQQGKKYLDKPLDMEGRVLPDDVMKMAEAMNTYVQNMMKMYFPIIDAHYASITRMLYVYLLTGETEEIPSDWMSKVTTFQMFGNTLVMAVASQASDPEETVQQFRHVFKKAFGSHKPKVTKATVSTAYYMQLQRLGKKWDFIVEEFIKRNKFRMPRDIHSKRYAEVWRKYSQLLRKRIQRAEGTLSILIEDKK